MQQVTRRVLFLALVVSLGGFLFGFDASVISGVVGFAANEFGLNDWQRGFLVGAPTLGAVVAAVLAGPLSDAVGRKRVLIVIAFLYTLSAVSSALAPTYAILVFARFLGGLAFGSLVLAPLYIAEVSPPEARGRMVSVNQLNIVLGFSAAYFANFILLRASGSDGTLVSMLGIDREVWRWMLGLEALPAVAYFALLFFVPESPRWLIVKGRTAEARAVLARLMTASQVDTQIAEIQRAIERSRKAAKSHLRALVAPGMRLPLLIGLIVGIAQQITGVNAVYFYAPSIFEQSGIGTDAAFAQAVWVGIINVVFTGVAMAAIDRIGRKPLLIAGLAGVLVSMSIVAWGFHRASYELTPRALATIETVPGGEALEALVGVRFADDVDYKRALREALGEEAVCAHEAELISAAVRMKPKIVLVGILGFVASFAVSLGPVMWVLLSEIFPTRIRGLAISCIGFVNSLVSFGVQLLFPWQLTNLGSAWTFFGYGLFALFALVFVSRLLPETRGKSLEELEAAFAARAPTGGWLASDGQLTR